MGPYSAKALTLLLLIAAPAVAEEPGWHYSPLGGEGDRATLGCNREATADSFTCLAVRCEDDFTVGLYVHSSLPDDTGRWEMTVDRENRTLVAAPTDTPYGGRFTEDTPWLRERLEQGTFVYLRHEADGGPFSFISLEGSLYAITGALHWCAPRVPPSEPIAAPGVNPLTQMETPHGPPPARTQ